MKAIRALAGWLNKRDDGKRASSCPASCGRAGCLRQDMALGSCPCGRQMRVVSVEADAGGIGRRLSAMGIRPGVELDVMQKCGDKAVIRLGGTRLAVAGHMLDRVQVAEA
jgi:Fe2+ transport system protein FeoA